MDSALHRMQLHAVCVAGNSDDAFGEVRLIRTLAAFPGLLCIVHKPDLMHTGLPFIAQPVYMAGVTVIAFRI